MSLDIEFKPFTTGGRTHPLQPPNVMLFAGPTGSGKTSTALHILEAINEENDDLKEVHFVTGNKKDKLLKILGEDVNIMSDPAEVANLIAMIKLEGRGASPHRVIMIDDCAAFKRMFNSEWFFDFVINHRHHNVQILMTCQGYHQINKQVRGQANLIFLYPTRNAKQRKDIIEEMPIDVVKMNSALNLIERGEKRSFLMINLQNAVFPKMFHNFNVPL